MPISPDNPRIDPTLGMVKPLTGWIQDHFKSWDGTKIFYRFYGVPGARHTLVMLHGYGEHSGRYQKFPEKMKNLSAQFAVMDLRGMGRSEGRRGDIGSFDDYLKDVTAFVEHLRKKHSIPRKFILFGHSLGGLVAVHWAMKNPGPVKLLVLSAPFLGLRFSRVLGPLNFLVRVLAPGFIYRNPVHPGTLSHDLSEVAIYRKDPLIVRTISVRLVGEIARRMGSLRKQPILSLPFPVHMFLAGEERIVDPAASNKFFDRLVAPRKERVIFDGFYHEIFNEAGQQKVFNALQTIVEDCV
jgi:alpha-beta hydrolase superfamily lysophospholipase